MMETAMYVFIALCWLWIVRTEVASRTSLKALDYLHARNVYLISLGRVDELFDYDTLPSLMSMTLDLTLWSWQDFVNRLDLPEV